MEVRREGKALMIYGPSLPEYLRDIWHKAYHEGTRVKPPATFTLPSPATYSEKLVDSYRWQQWRLDLIAPALMEPKYSEERGKALRALVGKEFIKPNGTTCRPSLAVLQAWVKKFEDEGEQALARKAREEKAPRALVNRRWDRESPLPPENKAEIAEEIMTHVRSLWAEGAPGSGAASTSWPASSCSASASLPDGAKPPPRIASLAARSSKNRVNTA